MARLGGDVRRLPRGGRPDPPGVRGRRHLAVHRRRLLRPRRRQAALRRGRATSSPPAASPSPRATPADPPTAETVCGLGNRKNDAFNAVLERDGVTAYPGSVALLDHLRDLGVPLAVVSSSANAPAVLAAAGLADRFVTVVDGRVAAALGLPGKPAPDTFLHAARECGAAPAAVGGRRGRRLRRAGRRRRRLRPRHRRRPRRRCRPPCATRGPDVVVDRPRRSLRVSGQRRGAARTRSTGPASRSTPGASSSASPDADDLGVTETLFAVANGYLGMRGNPEEGRERPRARHLRQRLPRDLADPARRGRLRLRPHRPDHRQRPRRQADEALRRRRAARPRHRRPRALRAQPRLPRRHPAPLAWCGGPRPASGSGSTRPGWSR